MPDTTTGSRMTTSAGVADPAAVQATAITQAVPLKDGTSNSTSAVPSGATSTMPE